MWFLQSGRKISPSSSRAHGQVLHGLYTFEDEDLRFFRNIVNYLPKVAASHIRRPES
jgi:hypothetical protein